MEDIQPKLSLKSSKHAVLSATFAVLSIAMLVVFPSDQGPTAVYFYLAFAAAIAAIISGWLGLVHIHHDKTLGGRPYALFGICIGMSEILFGLWAVGNGLSS